MMQTLRASSEAIASVGLSRKLPVARSSSNVEPRESSNPSEPSFRDLLALEEKSASKDAHEKRLESQRIALSQVSSGTKLAWGAPVAV